MIDVEGTAYLNNTTDLPISFTQYSLSSVSLQLDPVGWKSIADQTADNSAAVMNQLGNNALAFSEASPSASKLAEFTLDPLGTVLQPRATYLIGKPFAGPPGSWVGVFGQYWPAGSTSSVPMQVGLPEPSTCLLAILAGLGLVAVRVAPKRGASQQK